MNADDVMKPADMQFIGKKMGVIFQKEAKINIEEGDMFQPGTSDGDRYFHIYSLSRLKNTEKMVEFDRFGDMSLHRKYMPVLQHGI